MRYDNKLYVGLHAKYTRYSCQILLNLLIFVIFSMNTELYFMKIQPMGAELLRADRRTDITKLIVALRNFANASKICAFVGQLLYTSEF